MVRHWHCFWKSEWSRDWSTYCSPHIFIDLQYSHPPTNRTISLPHLPNTCPLELLPGSKTIKCFSESLPRLQDWYYIMTKFYKIAFLVSRCIQLQASVHISLLPGGQKKLDTAEIPLSISPDFYHLLYLVSSVLCSPSSESISSTISWVST